MGAEDYLKAKIEQQLKDDPDQRSGELPTEGTMIPVLAIFFVAVAILSIVGVVIGCHLYG